MSNELYNPGLQAYTPKTKASNTIPALAMVAFLACLHCATQFFAHEFQYQSALGAHLQQLFAPRSILCLAGRWYSAYTDAIMHVGSIGFRVTALRLIALVIARMVLAGSGRRNPYLHGSAHLANLKYIQLSGVLPRARTWWELTTGKAPTASAHVYVGAWFDKQGTQYLGHDGPKLIWATAPTRSGNSRTGRKPNRRSWVARPIQQNRRNNRALSLAEYLQLRRALSGLRSNQRPPSTSWRLITARLSIREDQ